MPVTKLAATVIR